MVMRKIYKVILHQLIKIDYGNGYESPDDENE